MICYSMARRELLAAKPLTQGTTFFVSLSLALLRAMKFETARIQIWRNILAGVAVVVG